MLNLLTILIVDDEKSIRDGLKSLIAWQKHGFHIIGEASNGKEALTFIKEKQPDIVITDLIMPKLDGLELAKIIQKEYPTIQFLVLSSYDNFSYVSESFKSGAVDYLLKPTLNEERLLSILKNISNKITKRKKFFSKEELLSQHLNRYLLGYLDQEETPLIDYLGHDDYYIIYTNLELYQNKQHIIQVLKYTLFQNLTKKQLYFSIDNNECGIILTTNLPYEIFYIELNEALRSLMKSEPDLLFLMSNPLDSLDKCRQKVFYFKRAIKEQKFYFKQHTIILETDFLTLNAVEEFDTKKYLRSLVNEDYLLGIARIEDYFNTIIEKVPKHHLLKQQANNIFYTLFSMLIDAYEDTSNLESIKQQFLFAINHTHYLEDFSLLILETIEAIKDFIEERQSQSQYENETIANITKFIDNNYQKNISLQILAETFHFNYNYLSKFFSQHFNTSFTEYLNSIRLKKAQELLLTSTLTLSDIALTCGYADLSYFSKLFKKYYGTSPSRYRRENKL